MRLKTYSKIKSIKKIGITDTYDLHTPKYHNFFLDNGILSHNSGKCHPKGTKILMSDGSWKNVEEVKEGDEVISPQKEGASKISKVIETHTPNSKIYNVVQKNKKKKILYSCSEEHLIPFIKGGKKIVTWSAKELFEKKPERASVFTPKEITFEKKPDPKIEPYTLGLFIGGLPKNLTNLESEEKNIDLFIPRQCLTSSSKYRWKLLSGLIETDGYIDKNGCLSYSTKSKRLAEDLMFLVHSLGGSCAIRKIKKGIKKINFVGDYYDVSICFHEHKLKLLSKKRLRLTKGGRKYHRNTLIEVKKTNRTEKVYGFEIDSPSSWYITDNWVVTHNSSLAIRTALKFKKTRQFKFRKNIIYQREELMKKLAKARREIFVADEAVTVAFNRDFYDSQQKDLIKMLNMNRDRENAVILCIPNFFDLDNKLRGLVRMWVHIERRGLGLLHLPLKSSFKTDKWDSKYNQKIEESWIKNGKRRPKYHKLSTFEGVIRFSKLSETWESKYHVLKDEKRGRIYEEEMALEERSKNKPMQDFFENIKLRRKQGNPLDKKEFLTIAKAVGKTSDQLRRRVNSIIKESGEDIKFSDLVVKKKELLPVYKVAPEKPLSTELTLA